MFLDYLQMETEKYTDKQIKMKRIWENILQYTAEQRYPGKHFFLKKHLKLRFNSIAQKPELELLREEAGC